MSTTLTKPGIQLPAILDINTRDDFQIRTAMKAVIAKESPNILEGSKVEAANYAIAYTLKHYRISENKLAIAIQGSRSTVNQWVRAVSVPLSSSVPEIARAIGELTHNHDAEELFWFIYRYYVPDHRRD